MSKEQFLKDYQPYVDKFGMVQNDTEDGHGNVSGNGNLYTANFILAAAQHGFIDEEFKERFKKVYANNERLPGLLMRTPDNQFGHNAHDDLIGAATASKYLDGGELARRIVDYGRASNPNGPDPLGPQPFKVTLNKILYPILKALNLWKGIPLVWNTKNPDKFHISSWLLRRRDVIATLELVGYGKTSLLGYLFLLSHLVPAIFAKKDSASDGFIHNYHMADAIDGVNKFTTFLGKLVKKRILKTLGQLGNIWGNPEHPNRKWL